MRKENNQSEKVSVNFMPRELGQIDALVEHGFYSDRSDLIRTAVRAELEKHNEDLKNILNTTFPYEDTAGGKSELIAACAGIMKLGRRELEPYKAKGKKIVVKMMGLLIIESDVTVELAGETIKSVKVWGKINASDEIKKILDVH